MIRVWALLTLRFFLLNSQGCETETAVSGFDGISVTLNFCLVFSLFMYLHMHSVTLLFLIG